MSETERGWQDKRQGCRSLLVPGGDGRTLRVMVELTAHEHLSAVYFESLRGVADLAMDGNVMQEVHRAWPDLKPGDRVLITIDRIA